MADAVVNTVQLNGGPLAADRHRSGVFADSQAQIAELFQVSVRTVQRRWESALVKLRTTTAELGPDRE
jgi:hypothetical protein